MQQTELTLHLFGTAPPIPPSPLVQSLPEPPLIPGCGRRVRPALTPEIGKTRQASAKHRKTVCMHAQHAHTSVHAGKATVHAGHALQSKQCITGRPRLASSCHAGSAHRRKTERTSDAGTRLTQFVVGSARGCRLKNGAPATGHHRRNPRADQKVRADHMSLSETARPSPMPLEPPSS